MKTIEELAQCALDFWEFECVGVPLEHFIQRLGSQIRIQANVDDPNEDDYADRAEWKARL